MPRNLWVGEQQLSSISHKKGEPSFWAEDLSLSEYLLAGYNTYKQGEPFPFPMFHACERNGIGNLKTIVCSCAPEWNVKQKVCKAANVYSINKDLLLESLIWQHNTLLNITVHMTWISKPKLPFISCGMQL